MKKTFSFNVPNKKPARQADSIKHEVKKYLGRERRKDTPEGVDFWDFDCKIGDDANSSSTIQVNEISAAIDKILLSEKESFYLEILSKAGMKPNDKK